MCAQRMLYLRLIAKRYGHARMVVAHLEQVVNLNNDVDEAGLFAHVECHI